MKRCGWVGASSLDIEYHDSEWGVPSREERHLFEQLILEGLVTEGRQALLSLQGEIVIRHKGRNILVRNQTPAAQTGAAARQGEKQ